MSAGYKVTNSRFTFHPKQNGFSSFDDSVWAPSVATERDQGIDVAFHGSATPIYTQQRDGTCAELIFAGADPITGVSGARQVLYPAEDKPFGARGSSYAVAAADSGIGLNTEMGRDAANIPLFYGIKRTYSTSPQIMGTYVSFQVSPKVMRPFMGTTSIMDVRSGQSIETLNLPDGLQFLSKMAFVLHNINDPQGRVEYSCNVGIGGKNAHVTTGRVWTDPDQGGHVVVSGKLLGRDIATPCKVPNGYEAFDIWTSRANASVEGLASMRPFRFEVTWAQFIKTLEYAAFRQNKTPRAVFGSGWNQMSSWHLKNVRYAHEFHNPDNINAQVGGMLKYFYVSAF